jgi:argininosuccinate lyase
MGSKVHAAMLAKQGLLEKDEADAIVVALAEIEDEIDRGLHEFKDEYEDIHMLIEQILVKKIGNPGKKLHTGRSRNDQVALDLRLYARDMSVKILELLGELCDTFATLSKKHQNDIMPGYTHLQQAQPITLGEYFGAYLCMIQRDMSRMEDWRKRMNFSPLGAGALAGSSLPLDRKFTAQELGFSDVIKNTVDAVSDRDYLMELCGVISIIMVHLSRLSEDLIIWATQEVSFITLDDAFATGSSLMPNKKNPDVLELIRGKSGRVFGHLMSSLTIMKALPLAYNKDMQEGSECLFGVVNTVLSCLTVMIPFVNSIVFNTERMKTIASSGYLNATRILEELVLKGVPFRDAHHRVGSYIAEAMEKGCTLEDIVRLHEYTQSQ